MEHLEIEQFLFTDYKERDAYENDVVKLHLFGFNGSETEHEFVGILELRELGVWFETGDMILSYADEKVFQWNEITKATTQGFRQKRRPFRLILIR